MSAVIRRIEIRYFRGIQHLDWCPSSGLNCIVGPGDSGKSTILDAIDLCLGARRTVQFADSDFYALNTSKPLTITIVLGALTDSLRSIETYGHFLRGFDAKTGAVIDEPAHGLETVLTLRLSVAADLEPIWELVSDRAAAQGLARNLAWKDRLQIAPLRIGAHAAQNFSWQRGSILTRLGEEELAVSGALTAAARTARESFGSAAEPQLGATLNVVATTAQTLGVNIGSKPRALLDAYATSFTAGGIALHNGDGVPLRNLGTGSTRLIVAGLQQSAAEKVPIVLVDEVEHGLEPHRLIRFLHALGAKRSPSAGQCFMSTHSPVAVRELAAEQLIIIRTDDVFGSEAKSAAGLGADGTIRRYPEALLARSVIVCEGATEVGLVRGLDLFRQTQGYPSILARGAALVDGNGDINQIYSRANAFRSLDYPVLILRDNDVSVPPDYDSPFLASDSLITWPPGNCTEAQLFQALPADACLQMVHYAHSVHGDLVREHVTAASNGQATLEAVWQERASTGNLSQQTRALLALASTRRSTGWFKQIGLMEHVAWHFVGPSLHQSDPDFVQRIERLFSWIDHHGG